MKIFKHTDKNKNGLIFWGLLFCTVFVCFLRIWQLDSVPSGFFVDESSIAFNGYTLLTEGVDEYGVSFPTYFKAFGEYKNPLYIYAQLPIFALFGLSRYTTRLVAALFMLSAALVFALIMKTHAKQEKIRHWKNFVVMATLLFLGLPWSFHLGRVAFELASFPVLFFLSIWFLKKVSLETTRKVRSTQAGRFWIYFAVVLGLLFYSYTIGRFLSPILFIAATILFFKKIRYREIMLGCLAFLVILVPAIVWEHNNPGSLLARYSTVASSNLELLEFSKQYIQYFTPQFLFAFGDGNLRHGMINSGPFVWLTIPFLFFGFKRLIQKEEKKFLFWVLTALFISPIPGSLTIPSPHILRSIPLLVIFSYLIGLGALELWRKRGIGYLLLLLVFIEMAIILIFYFRGYAAASLPWYEYQTVTALEKNITPESESEQSYLISQNLYFGTYVTGYFVYAQKSQLGLEAITKAIQTMDITGKTLANLNSGVVFLTAVECQQHYPLLLQRFILVESNSSLCVWKVR